MEIQLRNMDLLFMIILILVFFVVFFFTVALKNVPNVSMQMLRFEKQ